MNPGAKEVWLAALRDGSREQGTGAMHYQDGRFCCLGVLCDVYPDREEWKPYVYESSSRMTMLEHSGFLPEVVSEWAGLTVDDQDTLADMNDNGQSFEQIADYVEKNL